MMSEKNGEILTPNAPATKSNSSPETELDCSCQRFKKHDMNSCLQNQQGCGDPCKVSPCSCIPTQMPGSNFQQPFTLPTFSAFKADSKSVSSAGCGEPCVPVKQPITVQFVPVGPNRCRLQCPRCFKDIKTDTKTTLQKSAFLACFLLSLCGCLFCSCIPCCLQSFKAVHHRCPECHAYIGTYKH